MKIKRKVVFDLPPWWWWVGVFLSIVLIMFCKEQQKEMTLDKVVDALNAHPELSAMQVTCAISGNLIIDKIVYVDNQTVSYLANVSVVKIFLPKGWEEIKCKVPLTWPDE